MTEPTSERGYEELLTDTVTLLTQAARLTRPVLVRDETTTTPEGVPVFVESAQREPVDWAEFVTRALAGAAANIGGVETVLAGRGGSWEADLVRQLLHGTVGPDEEWLLEHRTEPVTVDLNVADILGDLGAWGWYDEAYLELDRLGSAIGSSDATDEEKERLYDEVADLNDRLDQLEQTDAAAYGAALKAHIEAAAAALPGLRVPVVVNVELTHTTRPEPVGDQWLGLRLADRLREDAIAATPLPGGNQSPLQRLGVAGA